MTIKRTQVKRETDLQIISDWIGEYERVLDIGCGRGILLEHLAQAKNIYGLGVDNDPAKIFGCIKRHVPAYQGDASGLLPEFADNHFDWVVLSRTVQELASPARVIDEALRVGRRLAVGFLNYGYWVNRWSTLLSGSRPTNEVFPLSWYEGRPYNPVTVAGFEDFCARTGIAILDRVYLAGDWKTEIRRFPNLRAGYAVYQLSRKAD